MSFEKRFYALGFFDGVHRGHAAILKAAADGARAAGAVPAVLTFDRRPEDVLAGRREKLLSPGEAREKLIRAALPGAEIVCLPFDRTLADMPAEDFVSRVLLGRLNAAGVAVGEGFRFGAGGAGTEDTLRAGLETVVVPTVLASGERVSSSAIRRMAAAGESNRWREALGHPFLLGGVVAHGDGRGRRIGHATLNLPFDGDQLYPAAGVYASCTETEEGRFPSVTDLGTRPTFYERGAFSDETHVIGPCPDLYGQKVWVWLGRYLRPERRFSSAEELSRQIGADADAAAAIFASGEYDGAVPERAGNVPR